MIRAKACFKCREFFLLKPNDANNLATLKNFEKKHSGHTVVVVDYNEIKGSYKNYEEAETLEEDVDKIN